MESIVLPNLIIGGVNRAGTTSLFTYLSWHKDICASTIKETNYFVPLLYDKELPPIEQYTEYFKNCHKESRYLMEATPRYIYGGVKMAQAIYEQLGMINIIFLLRDPIQRLYLYYKQRKDAGELADNTLFDEYVDHALSAYNNLRKNNSHKNINVYNVDVYLRGLTQGLYYDYLSQWYDVFEDSVKVCFFEDMKANPMQLMNIICKFLEIDPTIYQSVNFSIENKTFYYKNKKFHILARTLSDKCERLFRTHHPLKKYLRNIYYILNQSTEKKEIISEKASMNLRSLYDPYNKILYDMLCSKGYSDFPEWLGNNS